MVDELVRHHEERGIHRLIMDDGANALDLALMSALRDRIGELRNAGAPPIMIASSHPTLFCPGWNLKRLSGADREEVTAVLSAFNGLILDLFSYPGPTATAITGHAVAGGCLLALTVDLRVMASGRPRLGLAELNLGVPIPAGSLRMLSARLNPSAVEEVVLGGDGCAAEKAQTIGLVHRVAPVAEVVVVADRELRKLATKSRRAYAATKEFMYGEVWRSMSSPTPDEDEVFVNCWFEQDTRQRIAEIARSLSQ
jgi:enoyl-CoA hydratase